MKNFLASALVLASLTLHLPTIAQTPPQIIALPTPLTNIMLGDKTITVLYSIIENNNAHDRRFIQFVSMVNKGPAVTVAFEMDDKIVPNLVLYGGADCRTQGIRILQRGAQLQVVYASREGGWLDKQPFTLSIFEMVKNEDGAPGWPNWYFKQIKKVTSKASYCDANNALDKETKLFM